MSVAFDLDPAVPAPRRPPVRRPERPLATVTTLYRPSPRTIAAPVRLTRRGTLAVIAAVVALAVAVVALAWLSAPTTRSTPRPGPATIVVQSGDTLWRIAGRVAPDRDPLAEIDELRRLNRLGGAVLHPGQVLRTR
jgi:nucleoid-associated protein YgaU